MPESLPLRWLYLDLNSYFASVEQQLAPELRGRPVAVAPVHTDSTSAIAASYEAKAFGIRTGTPIWEARAKCRDLVVVPARHEEYVRFHHRIVAEVERHVPVTAVCSIDEVACRLCDNENGVADVTDLARRIKAGIAANVGSELKSSIGVAPNRLLAKMASDMEKPDGLTILEAATLADRLRTLRPGDIPGVGRNMERRLAAAGIVDMGRLLDLDPREARLVWGNVWGERLHWLLRGVDLPERPTARRTIGHSHVLGPDKRAPDRARLVARRLLLKAATRLRRMNYRTGFVVLTVKGEGGGGGSAKGRGDGNGSAGGGGGNGGSEGADGRGDGDASADGRGGGNGGADSLRSGVGSGGVDDRGRGRDGGGGSANGRGGSTGGTDGRRGVGGIVGVDGRGGGDSGGANGRAGGRDVSTGGAGGRGGSGGRTDVRGGGEGRGGGAPGRWSHGQKLVAAMDSFTLLGVLDELWRRMRAELAEQRYRQVSVTLLELTAAAETQLALFDGAAAVTPATEARRVALSAAIDRMNHRFGRDAVTVGHDATGAARSSGPKIAFTRIPDLAEFWE